MRKLLIGGLAALTCVAGVVAPATEAAARDRHYYRYHRHHDDDGYRYDRRYRYYDRGYYGRPYGYYERPGYYAYNRGYDRCRTTTRWDPWADTYIQRTRCW